MERYRSYYAWQEAMKLGLTLYHLADELPNEEQHLLASDLRRAAVEVPSVIAHNLLGGQTADLLPIIKLQTAMELIGKIYPALDTADAEAEIKTLADRVSDHGRFMEVVPAPTPVPVPPADEEDEDDEDEDDYEEDTEGPPSFQVGVNQG